MPISPESAAGDPRDQWITYDASLADEPTPPGHQTPGPRRIRRRLVGLATVLTLTAALLGLSAVMGKDDRASALVGHPEVLRDGCKWDSSGNYVQNCNVWSKSQNKWIVVQIRASNGSNKGVYLLDGMRARDDRSAWTTDVQAAKVYDGKSDTTLVMPAGGASSFYTDWDAGAGDKNVTIKQETFLTDELPAYLATNFGVSRSNNAIVGLSMSAGPAVTLAERHPEQFKVVQAMSGYYQTDNPIGALGVLATQTLVSNYTNGIVNMWGAPGSARWTANDPSKNIDKLKQNGQTLIISSGSGFPSPADMAKLSQSDLINAIALEILSAVSTVLMQLQLAQAGVSVISLPNYGVHNWANWDRGLGAGKNDVLTALNKTPAVTAKTQLVSAAGSPEPDGVAKATAAARVAAAKPVQTPAVLAALAASESSSASSSPSTSTPASASESAESSASTTESTTGTPSEETATTTTPAPSGSTESSPNTSTPAQSTTPESATTTTTTTVTTPSG
ncbi:alpha/beta hydrolase [Gordonia jacobaea]|uniref:alpha/beta hydrolase n=1 Tax=Gordonia jacobaea TaxID=122202 RepID=UPI0022E0B9FF|nr:alpha/beta hydrolase family protein [Gordonia jacobaea]